ncbi:class II fumarate hydratase [Candidatus Palauibacter sp.]|uniref:class II fumarate hydratase n=1 Tax=Candidatus Palauibacter sp. TaxID=3101350 RepID=UPI003B01D265
MDHRMEKDSMGEMAIPADRLYGAQTERARQNFPISDLRFGRRFIEALGAIKLAASRVNRELGLLDPELGDAIERAAREAMDGELDAHFVLDIFQTGSGTSTNMNANEVIANRAIQMLGGTVGSRSPVHPNDHVNLGQSSNDVIPTAIHVSALVAIERELLPALEVLRAALAARAEEFDHIPKAGRTHLQDATPVRLGQEFGGYASQMGHGIRRVAAVRPALAELAIGGTAVGTGINTPADFGARMTAALSELLETGFVEAGNHFEAQGARDAVVEASGALRTVAVSLTKIANDLRWLSSGPRTGLGEINLPAVQPGSSIMPGKVNPVMAESVLQVCAQVIGNDAAIVVGGQAGNLELNVMIPVMAHNLLQSIRILSTVSVEFAERCVRGITANEARCLRNAESTAALATALAPVIGYDKAAELAKRTLAEDRTLKELVLEEGLVDPAELDRILDFRAMTEPGLA